MPLLTRSFRTLIFDCLVLVCLSFVVGVPILRGGPIVLDNSFNGVGYAATTVQGPRNGGGVVTLQPDGKIIVAGGTGTTQHGDLALVRYNADGSLDTTFNGTGKVVTTFGTDDAGGRAIELQSDGKIVVAVDVVNSRHVFTVVRYNADGSLDTSFNSSGIVQTPLGADDRIYSLKIQANGKIVAVGHSKIDQNYDIVVVRYNSDGSLDTTFNNTGIVPTAVGPGLDVGRAVAIQPNGKIVVAAESDLDLAIVRYNGDGSLDTSFNASGFATVRFGDQGNYPAAVTVQSDGKIVVSGSSLIAPRFYLAVARFTAEGELDTSFNGSGKLLTALRIVPDYPNSLVLQGDGKLVLTGFNQEVPQAGITLVRLTTSGNFDPGFNGGGIVKTLIGTSSNAYAVALQTDNKIVAVGYNTSNSVDYFLTVARYINSSSQVFDFDGDGKTDVSIFRPSNGEWYILKSQAGLYGVGFGAAGDKVAPADYDGDGKTDVAVYRPSNGVWYVLNSANSTVTYYVFGAAEDLPTPGDYDGDGKADFSVFRPSVGTWFRINSSNNSFTGFQFGANGDRPALGDFDGDGKADISIYRPADGTWYRVNSGNGTLFGTQFGALGDIHVPSDYDGDGKTEISVFRPSNGVWYRVNSSNGAFVGQQFGLNGDIPAPGDFDGDGKADVTVFRPSDGNWYRLNSSNNAFVAQPFGVNGDLPTPAAFR